MKPKQIRGIYFCLLILGGSIIWSCATKEMESIEPFKYIIDDFDEVEALPELPAEEEPEEVEVDNAAVVIPEKTEVAVSELENLEVGENVTQETEEILTGFSQAMDMNDAEEVEMITSVNQSTFENIFREGGEVPQDLKRLFAKVENIPELAGLLPTITLPKIDGIEISEGPVEGARKAISGQSWSDVLLSHANARISDVVGPCADAAEAAYEEKLSELENQRENQTTQVESRYSDRITAFEGTRDARLTSFEEAYDEQEALIFNTAISLLNASNTLRAGGQDELANYVVVYAISFSIQASMQLQRMRTLTILVINMAYEANVANADAIRQTSLNTIATNYQAALANLQVLRNTALNKCHNQGAGN